MKLKGIALFILLFSVLASGVVFAQTSEAYRDGIFAGTNGDPEIVPSRFSHNPNMANDWRAGYRAGLSQRRIIPSDFNSQPNQQSNPSIIPPGVRELDPSVAEQQHPDYQEPGTRVGGTFYREF